MAVDESEAAESARQRAADSARSSKGGRSVGLVSGGEPGSAVVSPRFQNSASRWIAFRIVVEVFRVCDVLGALQISEFSVASVSLALAYRWCEQVKSDCL